MKMRCANIHMQFATPSSESLLPSSPMPQSMPLSQLMPLSQSMPSPVEDFVSSVRIVVVDGAITGNDLAPTLPQMMPGRLDGIGGVAWMWAMKETRSLTPPLR